MAPHVPAWKKLGLKLKYAKELPQEEEAPRKESMDEQDGVEGVNGEVETSEKKDKKKGKKRRLDEEEKEDKETDEKDAAPKSKKKKQVSFSADTKVRDGEEDEGSDQEAGGVSVSAEDKDGSKPGIADQQPTSEDGDDEQSATEVKEKKKKKKEKGKKKDTASTDSSQIHETPILSYLSHYHKYRQTWKFQKNRETHLFKHVLSLEQVPAQYNAALLAYLQGLKSEGAKQRLCQTAEEVVKADIENKGPAENGDGEATTDEKEDGNTPNSTDYDKAVDAFKAWLLDPKEDFDYDGVAGQLDADTRRKLEKRQRAELMVFAVQGKLFTAEKPKPKEVRPKKVAPAKKKRKNRTTIVEISSSSESESSSSSDSDSSDDESGKPNGAASKTSNSSSDSNSSDSSSDSDSDSDSTSSSGSSSSSSS